MELLQSKEIILNEVNALFEKYQIRDIELSQKLNEMSRDIDITHKMNQKLLSEIGEKDKLLTLNEKKCYDYEVMINKIQEDAKKEVDEKTKYDMLRAQDKEIFNRDEEIKRLQKKVDELEKKVKVEVEVEEYKHSWKKESKNSYLSDPEKVKLAIEGYQPYKFRQCN